MTTVAIKMPENRSQVFERTELMPITNIINSPPVMGPDKARNAPPNRAKTKKPVIRTLLAERKGYGELGITG